MTLSTKIAAAALAASAVSAGAPQEAQACVGNSCGGATTQAGNAVAQAAGGSATVNTPKLGVGVMLGGGSAAAVPDNCTKSYHILFWGQNNSDRDDKAAQQCRDRQGQLQIGLMAAQSNDPATQASGMALLGSMYPAFADINKKLVEKMTVCFNGGKDYVPAVPAIPAPAASAASAASGPASAASAPAAAASAATPAKPAIYGKPRELANHWVKISTDNPAAYCGPTIESVEAKAAATLAARDAHEIAVAKAGAPKTEVIERPAPVAATVPVAPVAAPKPKSKTVARSAFGGCYVVITENSKSVRGSCTPTQRKKAEDYALLGK